MAVVIILIGFIVASLVERLVRRFINYLDRSINLRLQANLLNVDMKASAAFISKTFFWIIMAIALIFCIDILRLDFLADWFELIFAYLPNIFASVVIFSAGIESKKKKNQNLKIIWGGPDEINATAKDTKTAYSRVVVGPDRHYRATTYPPRQLLCCSAPPQISGA